MSALWQYTDSTQRVVVSPDGLRSCLVTTPEVQAWIAAGNTPDPAPLATVQVVQLAQLEAAYAQAVYQPISYTTRAGVTQTFQADPASVANLQNVLLGAQGLPTPFPANWYWVAADNSQVPFTYPDVQGLAGAMLARGWTAFQHLQTQKAAVRAAATAAAVQAITW